MLYSFYVGLTSLKVIRKNERSSSRTVCKVGKKQYRNGVKWSKDACTACECRVRVLLR